MKTIDDLFRESIDQYKSLIHDANNLNVSITTLSPDELLRRCENLQQQQDKQAKVDNFINEIMIDSGPQILETPSIGRYQRVLDLAMQTCDELALKVKEIRKNCISTSPK